MLLYTKLTSLPSSTNYTIYSFFFWSIVRVFISRNARYPIAQ